MKIVAIRGENLTSLAKPFCIDFEKEPLASAGLFIISGQTGSGKSTILDALCLALFDKIPRLDNATHCWIGQNSDDSGGVQSNDVRSILRRGANSATAEVEFIGNDNVRYRATWSVRRARGRADGRLQAQEMVLLHVEKNQRIGTTKTEIKEEIEQRLGLNFNQFRRSVLLAQGDFAAFLQADHNERATLLERMTGTELYSTISILAHERNRQQQQELQQRQQQLEHISLLSEDALQQLQQQQQQLQQQQAKLQQSIHSCDKSLQWYAIQLQLQQQLQEVEQQALQIKQQHTDAGSRRVRLQEITKAHSLRHDIGQYQATRKSSNKALEEAQSTQLAYAEMVDCEKIFSEKLQLANELYRDKEHYWDNVQQELNQAKRLDVQLENAVTRVTQAKHQWQQQQDRITAGASTEHLLQKQCNEYEQQQQHATTWIEKHHYIHPLEEQWPRWQSELQQIITLQTEHSTISQTIADMQQELQNTAEQQPQLVSEEQQLISQLQHHSSELERLQQKISALPRLAQQLQLQEMLDQQLQQCHSAILYVEQFTELSHQKIAQQQEQQQNEQQFQQTEQQLQQLTQAINTLEIQLTEASYNSELAQKAHSKTAKQLRQALQSGSNCPVCGSCDHPWSSSNHEPPAYNDLLLRVHQLQQQREQQIQQRGALDTQQKFCQSQQKSFEAKLEKITLQQQKLQQNWNSLSLDICKQLKLSDPVSLSALTTLHAEMTNDRVECKKQLDAIQQLQQQQTVAQQLLDQQQQQLHDVQQRLHKLLANIERDTALLQQNRMQLQRIAANCLQHQNALEPVLQPIPDVDCDQQNIEKLAQQLADLVSVWRDKQQLLQHSTELVQQSKRQLQDQQRDMQYQQSQLTELHNNLQKQIAELQQLEQQRSTLFDGKATELVEQEMREQLQQAQQHKLATQREYDKTVHSLEQLTNALAISKSRSEQEQQHFLEIEKQLRQLLEQHNLSLQQVEENLQYDQQWINSEQSFLDTLQNELITIQSVVNERQQQLSRHMATKKPTASKNDTEQQLLLLQQQLNELQLAINRNQVQLLHNEQQMQQHQTLLQQLQHLQQEAAVWQQLSELIGSHDGRKFRTFAQSLTLDTLLYYANLHLQEFARRYQLMRVPSSDLDILVIDRDMGNEYRSVHSLSGGESFLVSLALALGLASLTNTNTNVESLFIDEGFGSLDQETLEVAMASLDSLQAMGRKVGIISHVNTMVERITTRIMLQPIGEGKSQITIEDGRFGRH